MHILIKRIIFATNDYQSLPAAAFQYLLYKIFISLEFLSPNLCNGITIPENKLIIIVDLWLKLYNLRF